MKAGLKQNFHFSLDSLTYFDPENCEQSYNLQAIQEPHPPCLMEPYPGGLGAPVTDEPCGWPPPPMYPAPSKVCLYLSLLSAASILGSRCHLMPPYWGPTNPQPQLLCSSKVENTLKFTRDLSSLLGLFLLRKGKSERKLELGRRGKKFMEIWIGSNFQASGARGWGNQLLGRKKRRKTSQKRLSIGLETESVKSMSIVHFILMDFIFAILDVTLASPWCASISILMNILMERRRMAFFVPFLERLHQQPLPRF